MFETNRNHNLPMASQPAHPKFWGLPRELLSIPRGLLGHEKWDEK